VTAAISKPGGGGGKVDVIGGFLKDDGALIKVSDEESGRIKGGDGGTDGRRDSPRKDGAEQGARQGNTVLGGRAGGNAVENSVGFVAERAQRGDLRVHPMGPLVREYGVGEALHQESSLGRAKGFVHAVEGNQISVWWPVTFSHQGGEEATPPGFSEGIPQSCFRRVKEVDPLAGNGPHKSSVDLNSEEGKSFPHPVEDGQTAIGRAGKDAT
jgi:hypothetical protein